MATILHVDMDAFFASVEQLHHPEWRGKPLVVGAGPHERGVVSTCSYEARAFGVRSAMPSRTAYERCPQAIFTPPHMELYRAVSTRAFEVFSHYSPYVEAVSIDEAFLDVSGTLHLYGGDPRRLGESLRREIRAACGVTCSVGIGPNRLLAKIGSEERKPDGLTVLPSDPETLKAFLAPRPVGILWGVGKKTVEALKPYGILTCGDLQRQKPNALVSQDLIDLACGRSEEFVHWEAREEKSVSREHTFEADEPRRAVVRARLLALVEEVGYRFRRVPRWATTARIKLRSASFETHLRQMPFPRPVCDDISFRSAALALFDAVWPEGTAPCGAVRLVGFGVTNFRKAPDDGQLALFASPEDAARERRERLSRALDGLRDCGLVMTGERAGRAEARGADAASPHAPRFGIIRKPWKKETRQGKT